MSSVVSSFNLSMFALIQVLMSAKQASSIYAISDQVVLGMITIYTWVPA